MNKFLMQHTTDGDISIQPVLYHVFVAVPLLFLHFHFASKREENTEREKK